MTPTNPPNLDLLPRFDLDFIQRLYRTTGVVAILSALLIWERFKAPAALGWLLGVGLSLVMYRLLETSVRRYITPESASARGLVLASIGKMVGLVVVGVFLAWAAKNRVLNLVWVIAGFTLPHVILVLKLIGRQVLVSVNRPETDGENGRKDTPASP